MGFMNAIRNFMAIPPEDDENYDDYEYDEYIDDAQGPALAENLSLTEEENNIVDIHATTQLQVVLVKPEKFEEASEIADHLNNKHTVVLNLESTSKDISRRLIDFLSGVAYANSGQIQRVANSTFIITPHNVGVMGDILDELENNGVFY